MFLEIFHSPGKERDLLKQGLLVQIRYLYYRIKFVLMTHFNIVSVFFRELGEDVRFRERSPVDSEPSAIANEPVAPTFYQQCSDPSIECHRDIYFHVRGNFAARLV